MTTRQKTRTATIVSYRVHPADAERNEELIRAVYAELADRAPEGLRYATHVLEDGVSFVHVAHHEDDGGRRLTELAAFREFQRELAGRCEVAPVVARAREVGSYAV